MKKDKLQYRLMKKAIKYAIVLILPFVFTNCDEDIRPLPVKTSDLQIAEYIAENPEMFSEFDAMLRESQIRGLLNSRGPLTVFLPTNEAIQDYYVEKGVTSYLDFDSVTLNKLILNHIVPSSIETNNMQLGSLSSLNVIGDYIVTEFPGTEIVLNKRATIIDRDINNLNGVTHIIDKVLDPINLSVYEVLEADGGYTIFTEGLKRTGIKDTLNVISIPFGLKDVRNRYTIFAVSDSVYKRFGIQNIDDLIATYSGGDDNITNRKNGFYQYMEYHCLTNAYFLSDFGRRMNYSDLSAERFVSVEAVTDFMINYDAELDTFTAFVDEAANIPSKNGVIHGIRGLLPVVEPDPVTITFEVTDYFDIVQESFYLTRYARFTDGQNRFEKVKWEGDFLLYYFKIPGVNSTQGDCWQMNGFFWIEVETPKIPEGDYMVSVGILRAPESPILTAYIDDVRCDTLVDATGDWSFIDLPFAHVNWKETKEHTFRLRTLNSGLMFWDYIRFTPREEK